MQWLLASENLFALLLFLASAVVLAWFIYAVILKKYMRARRIAHIRERREMEEAARR